jgi:hypothetical protein
MSSGTVTIGPPDGVSNVGTNAYMRLQFSKPADRTTVNSNTVSLTVGGNAIPVTFTYNYSGSDLVGTNVYPVNPLPPSTPVTVSVTGKILDYAGNAFNQPSVTFTTAALPDYTNPSVAFDFNSWQTGIATNASFTCHYSEAMDPSSVNPSSTYIYSYVTNAGVPATYTWSSDLMSLTMTPKTPLLANSQYDYRCQSAIDLTGNGQSNNSVGFYTGSGASIAGPQLVYANPPSGMQNVPVNTSEGPWYSSSLGLLFNEPVSPQSMANITLTPQGGSAIPVSVYAEDGNQIAWVQLPWSLSPNTTYTFDYSAVTDYNGNPVSGTTTSSFTTGTSYDWTSPTVASTVPANGDTPAAMPTSVSITFSKAMDPVLIQPFNVYLQAHNTQAVVPTTLSFSPDYTTVTLTPVTPLSEMTRYDLVVYGNNWWPYDIAGNQFSTSGYVAYNSGYVFSTFTTPEVGAADGVCGSANGGTFSSPPTTNLCSAGTASAITNPGSWTWTCSGQYGGNSASCSASLSTGSATPQPWGLVSWWPGNDNTNDLIGGNNGTLENGAGYALGEVEDAFSLNGSDQYVLIGQPVPANLKIQKAITLSAWVYPTALPTNYGNGAYSMIVGSQQDGSPAGVALVYNGVPDNNGLTGVPVGSVILNLGDGSVFHGTETQTQLPLDQWTLVTAAAAAGSTPQIFFNGVAQPVLTYGGTWNGVVSYPDSDWFAIGQEVNENRPFTGLIDEAQVYKVALSAAQVQTIYSAGSAGMIASETASKTTMSSSASTAQVGDLVTFTADVSPSSATGTVTFMDGNTQLGTSGLSGGEATLNTSTLTLGVHKITAVYNGDATYAGSVSNAINQIENLNGALCAPQPAGLIDWYPAEFNTNDIIGGNDGAIEGSVAYAPGVVGQAFSMNGSGDVAVSLPSLNTSAGSQATVSFWMNWNGGGTWQGVFEDGSAGLLFENGAFGFTTGSYDIWGIPSSGLANTWTYVTAVFNNGDPHQNQLYINGIQQTLSQQQSNWGGTAGSEQLGSSAHLGGYPGGWGWSTYYFNGQLDEVQIFNGALPASQIQSIYESGAAGVCAAEESTATAVSSSENPANTGDTVTFTATVTPSTATGTVTFMDGSTTLGTANISGGEAQYQTSALAFGTHAITAVYNGDTNYSGSDSPQLSQVITINGVQCAPQPTGLVSWWKGDGNSGDQTGLNPLTLFNGASYTTGIVNQTFSFTNFNWWNSSYARNGSAQSIPASGPIGFAAWVKYNSNSSAGNSPEVLTLDGPNACGGNGILHGIILPGRNTVGIARGCSVSPNFNCTANVNLGDNNWHLVVTGWDGTNATVYVDGALATQCAGSDFTRDTSYVSLGGRPDQDGNNSPYNGLEDEVQIYNRALTATEVQQMYAAGSSGVCEGGLPSNEGLKVTSSTLPVGYSGAAYSTQLMTSGGTGSEMTWSVPSSSDQSSLAALGLGLSSGGMLSGSKPVQGTAAFGVQVTDSGQNTATATLSVTINEGLTITGPFPLPSGVQGDNYSTQLNVTGGSGTGLNWSVPSPSDQAQLSNLGLNLSTAGVLFGSYPMQGAAQFTVQVKDSANNVASANFSVIINGPLTITSGSPLPSGTVGTPYSQPLSYSGGVGTGINWTVTSGSDQLSNLGLSLSSNGVLSGSNLTAGTAYFWAQVTDSLNDQTMTGLSVTINSNGQPVSGQINLNQFCGDFSSITLPAFTLTLNPGNYQFASNANGSFTINNVPPGTYTLTPSLSALGNEVQFYPAKMSNVVVGSNPVNNINFNVTLGYTVSGTVSYSGNQQSGPIYLQLQNNSCGASNGTEISGPGSFTIYGVNPGSYNLTAWRDIAGYGQANASDPSGNLSGVSVPANGNLSGLSVTMNDPSAVTLSGSPSWDGAGGWANGVLLAYRPMSNNYGVETPASYTIRWSTDSTFATGVNSASVPATGDNGANIWILNTANYAGLTSGESYYFQAQGVAGSSTSNWSSAIGPITLADPSGSGWYTVSGDVTWNGTAAGPLYVGFYDPSSGAVYVDQVGTSANPPTSGAPYSVELPNNGSGGYGFFAIVDNTSNGPIASGDFTNLTSKNGPSMVTINGNSSNQNLSLQASNSVATVTTQYSQTTQPDLTTNASYNLQFNVAGIVKQPVYVQLLSGPNVIQPVDMESCNNNCNGNGTGFELSDNIMMDVPTLTDIYSFFVKYSDGKSETITASPTPWNGGGSAVGPDDLATLISPLGNDASETPTFDWTYPSSDNGTYSYRFSICCSSNGTIWSIPGQNSKSNGFYTSQIIPNADQQASLAWDVDPTNSGNKASPSTLGSGTQYWWTVTTQDSAGNTAQASANFQTSPAGLALPPSGPLGAGTVNQNYNASITASGGSGSGYVFTVNGVTVTTGGVQLADGLEATVSSAGSNTLTINGTPNAVQSGIPVTVSVSDSLDDTADGSYTIDIVGGNVAFAASGAVSYSGSNSGWIYLTLIPTNGCNGNGCNNPNPGTAISSTTLASGGAFTIQGVQPGVYNLIAWMDNSTAIPGGFGAPNASNPTGIIRNVTVDNGTLSGVSITLTDPGPVSLSSAPTLQAATGFDNGAMITFNGIYGRNSMGQQAEQAASYTVEWSSAQDFNSVAGSQIFAAEGSNGSNIWILNSASAAGLAQGGTYYFRAQGVAPGSASNWSNVVGPVTISAPSAANTISGTVTFSQAPTGPLYVGFWNPLTGSIYATQVASSTSPAEYSVQVPSANDYHLIGILDQNNDGIIDTGDITNANGDNLPLTQVTASATDNLVLPSGNSAFNLFAGIASVTTPSGAYQQYQIEMDVSAVGKLPVAVTLLSGANAQVPEDIAQGSVGIGSAPFMFWEISNVMPTVGSSYSLQVTYSDGSTSGPLTQSVTALVSPPSDLAPTGIGGTNTTPTFSWTAPANGGPYLYMFTLEDAYWNVDWSIPGDGSNLGAFPGTYTSIPWNADPTGTAGPLAISSLNPGELYNVWITAIDANGNYGATLNYYVPDYAPLALPAQNPNTLGSATVGQSYSGSITASGGYAPYSYSVNQTNCFACGPVTLSNGLTVTNEYGMLNVSGTPTSTAPVSFQVYAMDSTNTQVGPVSYTIEVNAAPPASPTTTGLSSSENPSNVGDSVNFTATVSPSAATGTVTFMDGSTQLGSVLVSGGQAQISTSALGSGTHSITAVYSGDSNYSGSSSSTLNQVVNSLPSLNSVSGQINLRNFCGDSSTITLPTFTLTLNPGNYQFASNANGSFTINDVPPGTYTLTPSLSALGNDVQFYPAKMSNVVVGSNPVNNINFNVTLGYTVSGTVSYSGSQNGPIYLQLQNNSCGASNGTEISGPGSFTIYGVNPGSYNLNVWRDNVGYGQANASNPSGSLSGLSVPANGNLSGQSVTLNDAGAVTLSGSPSVGPASGMDSAVVLGFKPMTNNNGVETPLSYNVQWSSSNAVNSSGSFTSVAGSANFPAQGANGNNIWILNSANYANLNPSGTYYFQAQGVAGNSTSGWSSVAGPVTLTNPSGTNWNSISGKVTWNGTATGPLYVGFYDPNSGKIYADQVGTSANPPTSSAPYSVELPSGNYGFFAIVDNNNDGVVDAGDFNNISNGNGPPLVSLDSGSGPQNLTLQTSNSIATVTTQYYHTIQPLTFNSDGYNLQFNVVGAVKQPVYVQLLSGPNVISPVDMEFCSSNCSHVEFQLANNITPDVPTLTDIYSFFVKYSDGKSETITASPTPWNGGNSAVGPDDLVTLISPLGNDASDTPTFNWTYPSSDNGTYSYQFWVCCADNGTIWSIPEGSDNVGQSTTSNGFTSSLVTPPFAWGSDPTNPGNAPSPSALSSGTPYTWAVVTMDSAGNTAQAWANFGTASSGPLTLPVPNPSTLPTAQVNVPYYGTIMVTGGYAGYAWQVSGLSDGLYSYTTDYDNSGNNEVLAIAGTPTSTTGSTPISFTVTASDSNGSQVTQTYTLAVESSALSLPPSGTATALMNNPFQMTLSASGGSGPYSWTVNSSAIGSSGTVIGDNISASSTGNNQLSFNGTPGSTGTVPLNVTVTDSNFAMASQVYHINVVDGPGESNNSRLAGAYSCLTEGYYDNNNPRWASVSNIVFNGDGTVAGGVWNMNSRKMSSAASGTIANTTTYSIGSDNNGLMTMNGAITSGGPGSFTNTWALALSPSGTTAQTVQLVETDDAGSSPSGQHSSGVCYQDTTDTTSAFTSSTIASSSFALGFNGEDGGGIPKASVGRFSTDSNGDVNADGSTDAMKVGQSGASHSLIAGGSYSATSNTAANGIVNISMGLCNQSSLSSCNSTNTTTRNYIGYIVDANRIFMLETDPVSPSNPGSTTPTGLLAGEMRRQQQATTPTSGSQVSGPAVFYTQGWDYSSSASSTHGVSGYDTSVFQVTGDGQGNLTVHESYGDENGTYKSNEANGAKVPLTFDGASNPGRATFNVGDINYLYYYDTNAAFYLDASSGGYVASGQMENQTATPANGTAFANSDLAGPYMMAEMARPNPGDSAEVGEATLTAAASNNDTGGMSQAGQGLFSWDGAFTGTTQWDSANSGTTYGAYTVTPGGESCVVVTSTRSVCTSQSDSNPYIMIDQQ